MGFRILAIAVAAGLLCPLGLGGQSADTEMTLRTFTRSADFDGVTLYFTHVNNATVISLFEGNVQYSMRARANQSSVFLVQGRPDGVSELDTDFVLEQEGWTAEADVHNIQNFEEGPLTPGDQVDGLLIFTRLVDPAKPFTVRNGDSAVNFTFTGEALRMLEAALPTPVE
jgi:hypothetical protein